MLLLNRQRIFAAIGFAACVAVLLWPALLNRYPVFLADTVRHLGIRGFTDVAPPFYNVWLLPLYRWNLPWLPVIAQSAIVVGALWLALSSLRLRTMPALLSIVAVAGLGTYLPFLASTAHPDVFTSLGILAIAVLPLLSQHAGGALCLFLVGAAVMHNSHLPIFTTTLAAAALLHGVWNPERRLALRKLAPAAAALVAAAAILITWNYVMFGKARYSMAGSVFALALLQEDGPATVYLRENCRSRHFATCRFIDQLPMPRNDFLWDPQSPVNLSGGFAALSDEASTIVAATIRASPGEVLQTTLRQVRDQLGMVGRFPPPVGTREFVQKAVAANPELQRGLRNSRLFQSELGWPWLAALQTGLMAVSLGSLPFLLAACARRGYRNAVLFAAVITIAVGANAVFMGGVSGAHPRYAARATALVPLAAMVCAWALRNRRPIFSPKARLTDSL